MSAIVKRKQVEIELANDSYKLALNKLYGRPLKQSSLLDLFNKRMILYSLDLDEDTEYYSEANRKCLIARLGLTNDWKTEGVLTDCELPTVVTLTAQNISDKYDVNVVSDCTSDGGCEITERGICYSSDNMPTIDDNPTAATTGGTGKYSLNGVMIANPTYFRSWCRNEKGLVYGNIIPVIISVET